MSESRSATTDFVGEARGPQGTPNRWVILVAAVLVQLAIGAVFGLITMLFTLALIAAAVMAVLWALRNI